MELPRIRYTESAGGQSIAYYVAGHGARKVVLIDGIVSHLELLWEIPGYRAIVEALASIGELAVFDKRGVGLSDRDFGAGTLDDRMDDVRCVMDAAGFARATLAGISEGGALGVLMAAMHPERVERLVVVGGYAYGGGPDVDVDAVRLAPTWGTGAFLRTAFANAPADPERLRRYERNMMTPRGMNDAMQRNIRIDIRPVLSGVHVPTLVVHDRRDPIVPVAAGRALARQLPNARLVEVDRGYHIGWAAHDNDHYIDEIIAFVTDRALPTVPSPDTRMLATVMFTDIVQSTEHAVTAGDAGWRQVLDRYEHSARTAVERSGGRWVNWTGDGVVATFDRPGRALSCASALRRQAAVLGISTRTGVHTGEVESRGSDISGLAVNIAARVAAAAAPDEVWVSSTVPGLVIGAPFRFDSRGRHQLKGFDELFELLAVRDHA